MTKTTIQSWRCNRCGAGRECETTHQDWEPPGWWSMYLGRGDSQPPSFLAHLCPSCSQDARQFLELPPTDDFRHRRVAQSDEFTDGAQ
jgi:hypothetical protein